MKSKTSNRHTRNVNDKAIQVIEQMRRCCEELNLSVLSKEYDDDGDLRFSSTIMLADVDASFCVNYDVDMQLTRICVLHYDVTEDEWVAMAHFLSLIKNSFESVEELVLPDDRVIGCLALLQVYGDKFDPQHFRERVEEVVKVSRYISCFVSGYRDRDISPSERKKRLKIIRKS